MSFESWISVDLKLPPRDKTVLVVCEEQRFLGRVMLAEGLPIWVIEEPWGNYIKVPDEIDSGADVTEWCFIPDVPGLFKDEPLPPGLEYRKTPGGVTYISPVDHQDMGEVVRFFSSGNVRTLAVIICVISLVLSIYAVCK